MASDGNRKKRKLFEPKIPHFFKIILQESVDQGRLAIPSEFVRKYGNDLPNKIYLQVPSGTVWKMELVNDNGGVWMQNGWRQFQEYYSVALGTFLSFQYRSRSFFHVNIYDLSTTEIDYPYDDCEESACGREYKETMAGRNVENKADVIILDNCLPSSKKREKSPLPCPIAPKVGRTKCKSKLHTSISAKGGNKLYSLPAKSGNIKNLRRNTSSLNKSRAFKEAAGFKPENPSFAVVMKPAYINGNSVNIHINFATNYLKQDRGNVILQNLEKRTWTVSYVIYNEHRLARLASGWSVFVRDNNLVTGEKCIFELIDHAAVVLNVVIVQDSTNCTKSEKLKDRAHPYSPGLQSEDSCKKRGKQLSNHKCNLSNKNVREKLTAAEKTDALSRARAVYQPANPSFLVVIQPTYTGVRLDVPVWFAKRHFKENNCAIVLQVDGRTWTVHCANKVNRQPYFSCNWTAFVRDNNLEVGDVCIFELTKSAELALKVVIVRAGDSYPSVGSTHGSNSIADVVERNVTAGKICSPDGKSAGKQHRKKSARQLSKRLSSSWIHKVVEAAENFHSVHPCFKATMKFHSLRKSVAVPTKFMKYIRQGAEKVWTLQLQIKQKRWPVKLVGYPERNIWILKSGWSAFCKENRLQIGEICAFELVDIESLRVKVTIFRHNA